MKPAKPKQKARRDIAMLEDSNASGERAPVQRFSSAASIRNSHELGQLVKQTRQTQGLLQHDVIGIANVGNRFISELENGKPTLQIQKVLDVLDILGLEIVVRRKGVMGVMNGTKNSEKSTHGGKGG
jgi:HTH-type transcriptional regulator / antitoxin HipB